MSTIPHPLALVCELTHRCPSHCVYCSNPLELAARNSELDTETWTSVFARPPHSVCCKRTSPAAKPLARADIVELVRAARSAGLYVSLITSGLPLDESKLDALIAAGLDHFQLSFQAATEAIAEKISGTKTHTQKLRVLEWLKSRPVGVTLNFCSPSPQSSSDGRDAGHCGVFFRIPHRICERAILRLGICESRSSASDPATTR